MEQVETRYQKYFRVEPQTINKKKPREPQTGKKRKAQAPTLPNQTQFKGKEYLTPRVGSDMVMNVNKMEHK